MLPRYLFCSLNHRQSLTLFGYNMLIVMNLLDCSNVFLFLNDECPLKYKEIKMIAWLNKISLPPQLQYILPRCSSPYIFFTWWCGWVFWFVWWGGGVPQQALPLTHFILHVFLTGVRACRLRNSSLKARIKARPLFR